MFFTNEHNVISDIYTVCKMEWEKETVSNNGDIRYFNSISIRIMGNADIYSNNFSLSVNKGNILLIPKETSFIRKSNVNEQIIVVHFKSEGEIDLPECFIPQNYERFLESFTKLYNIWIEKNSGYFYDAVSVLNKILRDILREIKERQIHSNPKEKLLQYAIDYISEHFTESSLSVDDISSQCHISSAYLRRLFRKLYGVSPIEYITDKRIKYATELLQTRYYTVSEVSGKCGFQNSKYFSTLYKKKIGISPGEVQYLNP